MTGNVATVALGANIDGAWGAPDQTLRCCLKRLEQQGFNAIRMSPLYSTKAHGAVRQPPYLNAVLQAQCVMSPLQVIDTFKKNERDAGRRLVGRNGPRPLDIDLLDFAGRIVNWGGGHPRPKLVLPHPLLSERAFVLAPLADLAPNWRHPVIGLTARQLLKRLGGRQRLIRRREIYQVDYNLDPCEHQNSCVHCTISL